MFLTLISIGLLLFLLCSIIRDFIGKKDFYLHELIIFVLYFIIFFSFIKNDEKAIPISTEYKESKKEIGVIKEISIYNFNTIKIENTDIGTCYINLNNKEDYEIIYTDKDLETTEKQDTYKIDTKKFLFKEYKTTSKDRTFYIITINKEKHKEILELLEKNEEYKEENNKEEE